MFSHLLFAAAFVTLAADRDQTVRAYQKPQTLWILTELQGAPFDAHAEMQFPQAGVITGKAPCNNYRAALTLPYPWFASGPIAATRRACPDLAAETAFFNALEAATLSEVTEDTLTLSDENTVLLVFKAADQKPQ
jgi:heat shock protein HslJ